jgi:peptidylprolyl isomerase
VTDPRLALLAVVVGAALTGCGTSADGQAPTDVRGAVAVSGAFGAKPTIKIRTPLDLEESSSWVLRQGTGDKVGAEATVILQLTLADARTGKTALSTKDSAPGALQADMASQLFPSLATALTGKAAGSRVVLAATADDSYGDRGAPQVGVRGGDPVVMVADILSTDPTSVLPGPTGATLAPPATAPRVVETDGKPTGIDVTGSKKPKKLVVVPLREGTGPVVTSPERITVDYLGEVWGQTTPFESSYTKEPTSFSVGLGGVIPAWDQGLAGLKEGARVMLICPPGVAYGAAGRPPSIPPSSTLVFVIDVRGVGGGR